MPGADTKNQGLAVAGHNYVAQDQIWKDHISHETVAAKRWPENWNFLTTKYTDLVKDEIPPRKPKVELPASVQVRPVTPLSERVTVLPTPRPVPSTTSGLIGWRSTEKELKLEKYGQYSKPKGSLVKRFNWPEEAVD